MTLFDQIHDVGRKLSPDEELRSFLHSSQLPLSRKQWGWILAVLKASDEAFTCPCCERLAAIEPHTPQCPLGKILFKED